MGRRQKGDRVHGPYPAGRRWRLVLVTAAGKRTDRFYESKERAVEFAEILRAELVAPATVTVHQAIDGYEKHLIAKGNKPKTYKETIRRLRVFFPAGDLELDMLTRRTAEGYYAQLVDRFSVDSHRNMLAEAKTFLRWCAKPAQGWVHANVLEGVDGQGRRKHGKPQLRIDEARRWRATAHALAQGGELGAVAALMTLILGVRCSEVVSRVVRDVDDGGRLLWIPDSKTEAGRRTIEIPDELKPYLLALSKDRPGEDLLFHVKHDRKWPTTWVTEICTLAEVPRVTAHGMRGLHSTLAVDAGLSPHVVSASLGHVSFTTTTTSYVAPGTADAAERRKAMKVLDGGKD